MEDTTHGPRCGDECIQRRPPILNEKRWQAIRICANQDSMMSELCQDLRNAFRFLRYCDTDITATLPELPKDANTPGAFPSSSPETLWILVGLTVALLDGPKPSRFIIFQTEQHSSRYFHEWKEYVDLLDRAEEIWDYSWSNRDALTKRFPHWKQKYRVIPYGYTRTPEDCFLEDILRERFSVHNIGVGMANSDEQRPVDILFVGWHGSGGRRDAILDQITQECHNQNRQMCLVGGDDLKLFGNDKQDMVRSSKILINLHFYAERTPMESVRLRTMIPEGCLVVSEYPDCEEEERMWRGIVYFCEGKDMAKECMELLEDVCFRTAFMERALHLYQLRFNFVKSMYFNLKQNP